MVKYVLKYYCLVGVVKYVLKHYCLVGVVKYVLRILNGTDAALPGRRRLVLRRSLDCFGRSGNDMKTDRKTLRQNIHNIYEKRQKMLNVTFDVCGQD